MTRRDDAIAALRRAAGTFQDGVLMDWMQERGLVADEAVTLADCATGDLIAAAERCRPAAAEQGALL